MLIYVSRTDIIPSLCHLKGKATHAALNNTFSFAHIIPCMEFSHTEKTPRCAIAAISNMAEPVRALLKMIITLSSRQRTAELCHLAVAHWDKRAWRVFGARRLHPGDRSPRGPCRVSLDLNYFCVPMREKCSTRMLVALTYTHECATHSAAWSQSSPRSE